MSVAVFLRIEEMEQDSKGSMSKLSIEVIEKHALSGHAFLPLLVLGRL
jgi:ureidoglycolate hydrolase